jgi:hypothetical protein
MRDNRFRSAMKYSGIAIQMALTIILFNFLGKKLDLHFGKEWIVQLATMFGVFVAMASIIVQAMKEK